MLYTAEDNGTRQLVRHPYHTHLEKGRERKDRGYEKKKGEEDKEMREEGKRHIMHLI